ncbi:ABC-F family ATP-binding cassette domain-containing protein [Glaciecola sp. MH2013]|uniref:ABC transporter ATP-binding protein n=1 Tax=Glaciecola sp. MH2013 TaxID=2785524 RepID=UPI00189C6B97|nr:ATP-binding cassette domain-containing protein [Glaciecola sp. MH2013]MBF7073924.1 ABC-F family ATP-binding cassette domain-containing protein [Glaciecola sp. MH2013]
MILSCDKLSKFYATKRVFKDLSLRFDSPRSLLQGANGSGKSTLLRIIAGLEETSSGNIDWQATPSDSTVLIVLASESVLPPDVYTAIEVLALIERYQKVDTELRETLIQQLNFNAHLHSRVSELSSGSLKKLLLIAALSQHSDVLLLDEPFANLDVESRDLLKDFILADQRFQIIVDHHRLLGELPCVAMDD